MARQIITEESVTDAGIEPTEVDGHADGHEVDNDTRTIFIFRNTGAGQHVVTVQTPMTVNGLAVAERTYTIPAGETRIAGPFQRALYDQAGQKIHVDFDASPTEVKCAYIKVGSAL